MSSRGPAVQGTVAPGYDRVRDAFERNLAERGDDGCALAAVVDGVTVVDLWGGAADAAGRPWQRDTAAVIFSGSKGVVATLLLGLVERGLLEPGARVAEVWPEFGAAGKDQITVSQLLAHAGGVPGVRRADRRGGAGALGPDRRPDRGGASADRAGHALLSRTHLRLAGRGAGAQGGRPQHRPAAGRAAGAAARARHRDRRRSLEPARGEPRDRSSCARLRAVRLPRRRPRPATESGLWQPTTGSGSLERPGAARGRGTSGECGRHRPLDGSDVRRPGADRTIRSCGRTRSRPDAARPAAGTIRSRGGRSGSAPPATSWPVRRASSARPGDAFGHTGAGGGSHGAWPSLRTGFSYVTADLRPENADGRARDLFRALHTAITA